MKQRPTPATPRLAPLTPDLFRSDHVIIEVRPDTRVEQKLFRLLQYAEARCDRLQKGNDRLKEAKRLSICWTKVRKSVRLTPSPKVEQ